MSGWGRKASRYMPKSTSQLKRWAGEFGKEYTDRNTVSLKKLDSLYVENYGVTRTELNRDFLCNIGRSSRILEVGSNTGMQLLCLQGAGFKSLYGVEPQGYAVELSKKGSKGLNIIQGDAFDLPFKDKYFDIVFTSGVLIHINPKDIKKALKEIYRCSRKYIWGFEYYADKYKEIMYRGRKNMLWKTDFARLYLDLFNDLELVREKRISYLNGLNVDTMFLLKKKGK